MPFTSAHEKCLTQKVGTFGSLGPISMIQPPLCSSCVALQYEPRIKFSIEQFPSYKTFNIGAKISFQHVIWQYKSRFFLKKVNHRRRPPFCIAMSPSNKLRKTKRTLHLRFILATSTSLTRGWVEWAGKRNIKWLH